MNGEYCFISDAESEMMMYVIEVTLINFLWNVKENWVKVMKGSIYSNHIFTSWWFSIEIFHFLTNGSGVRPKADNLNYAVEIL